MRATQCPPPSAQFWDDCGSARVRSRPEVAQKLKPHRAPHALLGARAPRLL